LRFTEGKRGVGILGVLTGYRQGSPAKLTRSTRDLPRESYQLLPLEIGKRRKLAYRGKPQASQKQKDTIVQGPLDIRKNGKKGKGRERKIPHYQVELSGGGKRKKEAVQVGEGHSGGSSHKGRGEDQNSSLLVIKEKSRRGGAA